MLVTDAARELMDLPNTSLRFVFDEKQQQTSAQVLLQWCIDPQLVAFLRENTIKDPFLFICVTSPSGREERRIVSLWSMQELIQFHRPGMHTVYGRVLWGHESLAAMRKKYLKMWNRFEYENEIALVQKRQSSLGHAELKLEVPKDFFAKELSAWEKWWLTLWLGELWDECNIRRRRAFAYFIQGPLVLVWLLISFLVRFAIAGTLSGLLLERKINWRAVVHPFEYDVEDVWGKWDGSRSFWHKAFGSRILYNAEGRRRPPVMHLLWFVFPFFHATLFVSVTAVALTVDAPLLEMVKWHFLIFGGILVLAALFAAITTIVASIGIFWESVKREKTAGKTSEGQQAVGILPSWLTKAGSWFYRMLNTPVDRLGNYVARRADERTERLYQSLQCDTVPESGLRPIRALPVPVTQRARLLYQQAKSKVCKPMARG